LILIGMPEPDDGWFLDEVEAALFQAEATGRLMPRREFVTKLGRQAEADFIAGLL
jgi:hypothetical protein